MGLTCYQSIGTETLRTFFIYRFSNNLSSMFRAVRDSGRIKLETPLKLMRRVVLRKHAEAQFTLYQTRLNE